MSVLIPLLSKLENDTEFLSQATDGEKEVLLLAIVDSESLELSFGFTATQISQGNALIEEIREILEDNGKRVYDVLEWGSTLQHIINFARLKKATKIALKDQDSEEFHKLVKELQKSHHNVQVI